MARAFHPVLPFNLIQGIRLAHALMESRFEVCIPERHSDKFSRLEERFGIEFRKGVAGVEDVDSFEVDHSRPKTSIGSIERPLIFPKSIVKYCRSLWGEKRKIKISFEGLVTEKRKKILSRYAKNNFGKEKKIYSRAPAMHRIKNKIRRALGLQAESYSVKIGDMNVFSSRRGREFPVKAWDEEYFRLLSNSKFIICPNGDYVWSYRFFESILCGAIPIIEEKCEAYSGFFFYKLTDNVSSLKWSKKIANQNYNKCRKEISVGTEKMNYEIENLLK